MDSLEFSVHAGFTDGVSPPVEQEDGSWALVIGEADWTRCPADVAAAVDGLAAGQKLYFQERTYLPEWTCPVCGKASKRARLWTFRNAPLMVVECLSCEQFCWLTASQKEDDDG